MISVSIRKNDEVMVLTGKDKGKQGKVLRVLATEARAVVEGINKIKRHVRPNPGKGSKGGIVEREASIHVSNLKVVCPSCGKPVRVGRKKGEDGRSVRTCKKCSAVVEREQST